MAKQQVHVVARFAVKPESVDQFIEMASATLVVPSREEPGCIRYDLCQDLSDSGQFSMIETWACEEDLARHLERESVQAAVGKLTPMGAASPIVSRLCKVGG